MRGCAIARVRREPGERARVCRLGPERADADARGRNSDREHHQQRRGDEPGPGEHRQVRRVRAGGAMTCSRIRSPEHQPRRS